MGKIWKELYNWGEAMELNTQSVHIEGEPLYDLSGRIIRWDDEAYTHIASHCWLRSCSKLSLPQVVSFKSLMLQHLRILTSSQPSWAASLQHRRCPILKL